MCVREDLPVLFQSLVGLRVSYPWAGHGTTVFLELGKLTSTLLPRRGRVSTHGEAVVMSGWTWRVEKDGEVLFGSSTTRRVRAAGLASLRHAAVASISVVGDVPDLRVEFEDGRSFASLSAGEDEDSWSVKLMDQRYVFAHEGAFAVQTNDGYPDGESPQDVARREEDQDWDTAARWEARFGVHAGPSVCYNCRTREWLDVSGPLSDFLVCTSASSPFDGQIVTRHHGCNAFVPNP